MWSLESITAPVEQALTVVEAKGHSRLDALPADAQADLELKIAAAVTACESFTERQLVTATWELWLSSWCEEGIVRDGVIRIPRPPLQSLTSVKYLDLDGTEITMDSSAYQLAKNAGPQAQRAILFPAYATTWPTVRQQPSAIKIRFVCGYGAAAAVPPALKQGMLLRIAEYYEHREEQSPGSISTNLRTAEALWSEFRVF